MYRLKVSYEINDVIYETHQSNEHIKIDIQTEEVSLGTHHKMVVTPEVKVKLLNATLTEDIKIKKETQMLFNGYQSWTQTKIITQKDRMLGLNHVPKSIKDKYKLTQYGDYNFTRYQKHLYHGFTYAYIKHDENLRFWGSLNEFNAYLIIYIDTKQDVLTLESDVHGRETDGAFTLFNFVDYQGHHDEIFENYLDLCPKIGDRPKLKGYSSWYNHYQDINETKILDDLKGLNQSYELFQIDDGYEAFIGDWLDVDQVKFPDGLSPIIKKINEKGLMPGLWMAPFVCESKSRLLTEHPEFLAYDDEDNLIDAGSNWSGFYMLDWQKKEVQDYIRSCFYHYIDLGFKFFKLDFLYAAALKTNTTETRAETMRKAVLFLRSCVPSECYILGCGVSLSSSFGVFDYMRIGPDVSLDFDDKWFMKYIHRERISTKETLLNTIYRHELDGHVFYNDPDVYLLRDENTKLKRYQKEALVTLNFLFGSLLLTSDQISSYTEKQRQMYQKALPLLQAKEKHISQHQKMIKISYTLKDRRYQLIYHLKKGKILSWQELETIEN